MIEFNCNKWKGKGDEMKDKKIRTGFVLLSDEGFNIKEFKRNLYRDWEIMIKEEDQSEILIFEVSDIKVVCALINSPVPNKEAEENAMNNYLWKEGEEETAKHKAHIVVSVTKGENPIGNSIVFTMVVSSLLKLKNAIGIYQYPTVLPYDFYIRCAEDLKEKVLPVLNWIYIGIYPSEKGFSAYTCGMDYFDKDEIEVINSKTTPSELYGFIYDIVSYVLEYNAVLNDGETIGFSEKEKLPITKSKGVAVEGNSIKIKYK